MNPITEDEYDDLDIPFSAIDSQLVALGDLFDIDPLEFIDAYDPTIDSIDLPILNARHGAREVAAMCEMIDLALNSSTEIPHIREGIRYLVNL